MKLMTKDREFYRTLLRLAVPIVLQSMISFAVNFADNLMVGRLGDIAVSGVYMGNNFQTVLTMFIFGIDAAMLIMAAQYWGLKDTVSIKRIAAMGIRWSVFVGLFISAAVLLFPRFLLSFFVKDDPSVIESAVSYVRPVALSYVFFCGSQLIITAMKAVEKPKLGFWVSFIALFVNIILNWALIFGKLGLPALGVRGAGIATLISRIVEFLIAWIYAFHMDKRLGMRAKDLFLVAPELRKDLVKHGLPVILGQLVWAVNLLFYSGIMGRLSASAVTAASMVGQLESLLRVGVFGLSGALGIISSKTVGAGLFDKMKEYTKTAEVIFLVIGLLSSLLILILKEPFLRLYNVSDDAFAACRSFIRVLNFTYIGTCWQATMLSGVVKSGGDTSFVFKNDSCFVFLVLIPAGLISLKCGAPAWVVYLCLKCDQILKCIPAYFKVNSFNWMKKLTRENINNDKPAETQE